MNTTKQHEFECLDVQIQEIDKKIKALGMILEVNKTGMKEPLVDAEGFPRNDIDVVAVRTARHDIICLQNDRKALIDKIWDVMCYKNATDKKMETDVRIPTESNNLNSNGQQDQPMEIIDTSCPAKSEAFARVKHIVPGLPAERAGLKAGDLILKVGTLCAANFKSLNQIATIMSNSVGRQVRMLVRKNLSGDEIIVSLTPPKLGIEFEVIPPSFLAK